MSRITSALAMGATAALAVALVASGCSSDDSSEADSTSTTVAADADMMRIGIVGPFQFDPARAIPTDQGQLMEIDLLFDSLTAIDPSKEDPVPALAESWTPGNDFTEWDFVLRDGAAFADGTPITGDDVKFSLERVASQGAGSLADKRLDVIKGYDEFIAGDEDGIGGITVSDDGATVHITTAESYAPLPEVLASPIFAVVPAEMAGGDSSSGDSASAFFAAPVGSGPLQFAGADVDTAAAADRPEGADDVRVLVPSEGADLGIEGVELIRFPDAETSYQAFRDGELDWSRVPAEEVDAAAEEFGESAMMPFHAEFFLGINVADDTYGAQKFREAIARSIDRQAIVEDVFTRAIDLNGTLVSGVPGFQEDPCGTHCAFDPDAAAALLDDEFGDDGPPTVELDYEEGERGQAIVDAVAADLDAVGIDSELRPHDPSEYVTFVTSGEQEIFVFGWVGIGPTPDSYLAPLFLSGSPDNVTGFGTTIIDASIAAARSFETPEERAAAYQAVEETIMAEVPVIPLGQVRTLAVVSPRVQGWAPRLNGTFVIGDVTLEE